MEAIFNLGEQEYRNFTENNKDTHFLQSYEWGEVSKLKGWRPYYLGIKNDDKIIATALLLKKRLPLGYSYFYIPRGYTIDYTNRELLKYFTEQINLFTKKHKSLFFKIDPDIKLHNIDAEATVISGENNYDLVNYLQSLGFKRKKLNKFFENEQPRFTFRINLDSEDNIDKRYSKTVHRFIKKANSYAVTPYIGNEEEIKEFIRLTRLTEKRQHFYSHSDEYYRKFYQIFKKNNHVELLLAKINTSRIVENLEKQIENLDKKEIEALNKKKDELEFFKSKLTDQDIVVSSYLTVFYGNKAWYLYGANDLDYKMTLSNYKLFDFQIKTSFQRNAQIFDEFGTIGDVHTTNKLIGIHEFKKKFGGEYIEFIGEFDYIQKPFMNLLYHLIIPIRRKIVRVKLRNKGE